MHERRTCTGGAYAARAQRCWRCRRRAVRRLCAVAALARRSRRTLRRIGRTGARRCARAICRCSSCRSTTRVRRCRRSGDVVPLCTIGAWCRVALGRAWASLGARCSSWCCVWCVVLCRHAGQEEVVVGSPYHGRDASGTEGLIGYFVNMLALRVEMALALAVEWGAWCAVLRCGVGRDASRVAAVPVDRARAAASSVARRVAQRCLSGDDRVGRGCWTCALSASLHDGVGTREAALFVRPRLNHPASSLSVLESRRPLWQSGGELLRWADAARHHLVASSSTRTFFARGQSARCSDICCGTSLVARFHDVVVASLSAVGGMPVSHRAG